MTTDGMVPLVTIHHRIPFDAMLGMVDALAAAYQVDPDQVVVKHVAAPDVMVLAVPGEVLS